MVVIAAMSAGTLLAQRPRIIEYTNPKLTVCLPPERLENGKAVVALPGGGYSHLAVYHEGFNWAPFFTETGTAYAVLEYSMPDGDHTIPMSDVEAAFKIMTDSASAWGFSPDSIGIMGSSAGGHLAATMATHPTEHCHPAFQILFYPVISLDPAITHKGTHKGFLGENPPEGKQETYSSELQVKPDTPKAIIMLSGDDKAVPAANSLRYYQALIDNGVPASLHIYPSGGHGWGYKPTFKYHDQALHELRTWIKEL